MPSTPRRRPLWCTGLLYALMVGIIALDVWTVSFWVRVGGSLGWTIVGLASAVALSLSILLTLDAQRQRWVSSVVNEQADGASAPNRVIGDWTLESTEGDRERTANGERPRQG